MKKLIIKITFLTIVVYGIIVSINYKVDPANLYNDSVVSEMVDKLRSGEIIEIPGDVDEGIFQEMMISSFEHVPDTVVIGSSHVMYIPWEFQDYYVAGLSGAFLGDYYAIVGILEKYDILPRRVIIGVDPWAFTKDITSGRHASIGMYAEYAYNCVYNQSQDKVHMTIDVKTSWDKIKEIVSFSYFQSSLKKINENSLQYYMNEQTNMVEVALDESVTDVVKILPNGRRIMKQSSFKTVEENNATSQRAIESKTVYQLEGGYSEVENIEYMEELVRYLLEKGITVELYLPSWYPKLWDCFENEEQYRGILLVEEKIRSIGVKYGVTVHGTYNPYDAGIEEDDFADWLHLKPEKMLENYNLIVE